MLRWDDLRYFLAFTRAGSMRAAAKALGVNQSTVQRRIAELEERIGRPLVERRQGAYSASELGEKLLPAMEAVDAAMGAFERDVAARDIGPGGTLRVTCGSTLADRLRRSGLIDLFHARHPGLQVELVISDRFLDLSAGEAEIAIRLGAPKDAALVGRKIAEAPWAVYASRAYVDHHGRPDGPADIARHALVGAIGAIADYPGARWLSSVAPDAPIASRSDNWPGLVMAVKSGGGLAALLAFQGDNDAELVRVVDDIGVTTPYYLVMHRDLRNTPRVRAFADFVAAEIKSFRAVVAKRPASAG